MNLDAVSRSTRLGKGFEVKILHVQNGPEVGALKDTGCKLCSLRK